jgi:hypothetical protein
MALSTASIDTRSAALIRKCGRSVDAAGIGNSDTHDDGAQDGESLKGDDQQRDSIQSKLNGHEKLTAPLGLPRRSPTLVPTGPCAA